MSTIKTDFGYGGSGLTPAGQGTPTLAEALRDIADDLETVRSGLNSALSSLDISTADPTAVAAGALSAFTDPPSAGEMATLRTLVNQLRQTAIDNRALALEIKGDINAATPGAVVSADPAAVSAGAIGAFTNPPTAGEMATLVTLVNQIRTTAIANRTLVIEEKTVINAANFGTIGTLLTQKG